MPETVFIDSDLNIIQVDSFGKVTEMEMNESLDSVIRLADETGLKNVLVNALEQDSMPTLFELYDFGNALVKKARLLRFAVVPPRATIESQKFLETVSFNRGAQMNVFGDIKSATDWLLDQTKSTG